VKTVSDKVVRHSLD